MLECYDEVYEDDVKQEIKEEHKEGNEILLLTLFVMCNMLCTDTNPSIKI